MMVMTIPIFMDFTAPRSHTSKGLPISMHAATSYTHLLVLGSMGYYSLVGIQPERLEGLIASGNSALPELNSLYYVHTCVKS